LDFVPQARVIQRFVVDRSGPSRAAFARLIQIRVLQAHPIKNRVKESP
jgi:hypothetical protein